MNKQYIQNIEEITDSCEMLQENPRKYISIFAYMLICLILIALIWCFIGKIDYYIKAPGIVRPGDNVSTVRNMVTGKITEVNISEGAIVKKGDVLFKIDTTTATQTVTALENQKQKLELDILNLNKFNQSINDGENLFNKNSINEVDYYNKYDKYTTDIRTSIEQYRNTNLDIEKVKNEADATSKNATTQLEKMKSDLQQIDYLIDSLKTDTCKFPQTDTESIYYKKYQEYNTDIEKYNQTIKAQTDLKERMEKLFAVGGVSKVEYEKAQNDLKAYELELSKSKQDFLVSIVQIKDQLNKDIDNISASAKNAQDSISIYSQKGYSESLASEKIKLDTLLSISNQIIAQQNSLDTVNKDLKELQFNVLSGEVTAPIDGTINIYSNINVADYVESGLEVATIVPNSKGKYKVLLYIGSSDISQVKVNQKVKLRISSLPYQEYGELGATIVKISSDTRTDSKSGTSYYIAECILDKQEIKNKNGETKQLLTGMNCEARVITKQRRIIFWLLEKMNFID